ncbi:hypothetical protein N0V88_002090 [Collariella sp. IMI 366227]|nr:hypothetical protein N0V88_002090 [Collariella sp. IMI 366227]
MDDPWGSPWARTDPDKDPRPSSPAKSDLAPPPRAFLSASNSPRISAALEQSPWGGDDDGFGDWATATTSAPDTPSGHGVWAGGWGGSSPHLSASPRDDVLGKATPIAWPGNVATPKPASGSGFPQPSPDPWASGFSSRRPSIDGTSTPRLVVDVASPVEERPETFRKDVLGIEEGSIWDKSDSGDTTKQATIENQDAISRNPEDVPEVMLHDEEHGSEEPPAEELIARTPRTENQVVEDQPVNEETAKEEATTVGTVEKETDWEGTAAEATTPALASENDVRMSVESAALGREYQSTTPSHENTDHEDERQDSPITPIDDETRIHRPVSRKTSGKVQELVVKFDGLARAASQERAPVSRASSSSPPSVRQRVLSDDAVDFGDFEDADDADDVEPPLAVDTTSELLAEERHADAHIAPAPLSFERNIGSTTAAGSPVSKFGPLHFSADLDMIGKLFPALGGSPGRDIDIDREVPDQVISDSFTEISERKTWYRVSRFGSSRRHNAGDDESYRRVVWPTSTVHQDTIKIVRRWMEEDSIAGRVALGGGISKTQKNMFGWDSSAEPVDLDTVFKKRSHSRTSNFVRSRAQYPGASINV